MKSIDERLKILWKDQKYHKKAKTKSWYQNKVFFMYMLSIDEILKIL